VRGTLEICEDKEVGRKLEILDDDVTEAIDLGTDVVHLRRAPSMVRECYRRNNTTRTSIKRHYSDERALLEELKKKETYTNGDGYMVMLLLCSTLRSATFFD
jgi:hypothetical protein